MSTEYENVISGFAKYFQIVQAITTAEMEASFRIRHSVYCEDLGWEPTRADGMEIDVYDAQSLHCLIQSRVSGEFIGCVRLICTGPDLPIGSLPFEETCNDVLDRSILDPAKLNREKIAEVSRLGIVRKYRRRYGERDTPGAIRKDDFGSKEVPRFPFILTGLYVGVFAIAQKYGLEQLFMLCEPRLMQHLNKIGIANLQIGKCIEYRGSRAPAVMDVQHVIANFDPLLKPVFLAISKELNAPRSTEPSDCRESFSEVLRHRRAKTRFSSPEDDTLH